jgi:hypothetical protein
VNWISVSMVSVTEPCGDWACPSHPFAEVHRGVWEPGVAPMQLRDDTTL